MAETAKVFACSSHARPFRSILHVIGCIYINKYTWTLLANHCCGRSRQHARSQCGSRSAIARLNSSDSHSCVLAAGRWESCKEQRLNIPRYYPLGCTQLAKLHDFLSALLDFINSCLESAAKIGVEQLSANVSATRNKHLQRDLLKEPSSL